METYTSIEICAGAGGQALGLESNVNHILKVAERKAEYLKLKSTKQGKIEF